MLLGIDVGSSAVKGALVDPEDGLLASAQADVAFLSEHPGWAEADPREWWSGVRAVIPELLKRTGRTPAEIAAVAIAGMVPAVLALDTNGSPLRNAILQNDARAATEINELGKAMADTDFVGRTGSALTQQSVAPTLRWLRRHEPDLFKQTATVVGSYDWLARRVGADAHVEQNWALESGLFTLDGELFEELFTNAGASPALIPPVRRPGELVGHVSADASSEMGLRTGTPIVVGGADHVTSAYGAGLLYEGDWLVKLGGAGDILVVSDRAIVDERLYLDAHPAGQWLPNGCMATSGSLIRWLRDVAGRPSLEQLESEAAAAGARANGVVCLPYFLGEKSPLHDPALRGAFVGLHLGHSRGDLFRSALEAVAFGFRHHVDVFTELGVVLGQARVTNGGSRSQLWKQILADVLGVELYPVLDHPGASFAAAFAAGVGTGVVADWRAIESLIKLDAPVQPDLGTQTRYDDLYSVYRDLEPRLRPIAHRLAGGDWT